jgi:hypothetical protein
MHIPLETALRFKDKREGSYSFTRLSSSGLREGQDRRRAHDKKETLWLGVEPRLPAFRQMFSIKLTSKCTNRYTTKDWCKPKVCCSHKVYPMHPTLGRWALLMVFPTLYPIESLSSSAFSSCRYLASIWY